jgi:hypothetical protein
MPRAPPVMSATLSFSLIARFFPSTASMGFSLLLEVTARHTGQPGFVDAAASRENQIT